MADPGGGSRPEGTTPEDRDASADERDRTSAARDRAANERDSLALLRDVKAEVRDDAAVRRDVDAAADRTAARRDRRLAKGDRAHAGHDRQAASTDRALAREVRAAQLLDDLTGCHRRAAGLLELEREILRAERTERPFTLAFVDVDGLKAVNDRLGHEAGDDLLCAVVRSVRGVLRAYDVIVRYGGDEFVCGLADLPAAEALERFERANTALQVSDQASVSVGAVERQRGEGLAGLIRRADAAMYASRERRPQ